MVKSHDEHQALILQRVNDVHNELDRLFSCIVEDRIYSTSKPVIIDSKPDLEYFKSLVNKLRTTILLVSTENGNKILEKKPISKSFGIYTFGFVNLQSVAGSYMRILRVQAQTTPKLARANKADFEALMGVLDALHQIALEELEFLIEILEEGLEGIEGELGNLILDLIKVVANGDFEVVKRESLHPLIFVSNLVKKGTKADLLYGSLIQSGLLAKFCSKVSSAIDSHLSKGVEAFVLSSSNGGGGEGVKRAHASVQSDKEINQRAEHKFKEKFEYLSEVFIHSMILFKFDMSIPLDQHTSASLTLISLLHNLIQHEPRFPSLSRCLSLQVYPQLYELMLLSIKTFQPTCMAPFLPMIMKLLVEGMGREEDSKASKISRDGLRVVDLIIRPRRYHPFVISEVKREIRLDKGYDLKPAIRDDSKPVIGDDSKLAIRDESRPLDFEKEPTSELKPIYSKENTCIKLESLDLNDGINCELGSFIEYTAMSGSMNQSQEFNRARNLEHASTNDPFIQINDKIGSSKKDSGRAIESVVNIESIQSTLPLKRVIIENHSSESDSEPLPQIIDLPPDN